jgi:hypothetical protein
MPGMSTVTRKREAARRWSNFAGKKFKRNLKNGVIFEYAHGFLMHEIDGEYRCGRKK